MVGFIQGIGAPELIIILVIVLLLFGAKRLPEMARSIGKSTKEFKKGMAEGVSAEDEEAEEAESDRGSAETPPKAKKSSE